jgi:defect-in-organelle-trafficking protein DotB
LEIETQELILLPEQNKITHEDFYKILFHMVKLGASDTYLHSGDYIIMDISGRKTVVTNLQLTFGTIEKIAKRIAGDDAVTRLNSGDFIDKEFDFKDDGDRYRFRINITYTIANGNTAIQITIREIPVDIPSLEKIGCSINDEIYQNFFPAQGLVLVTGPTGSGKSTLMASCIAQKLQDPDCHRIFNAYEAPIEFVYDKIDKPTSRIYQTPVRDVKDFSRCISNSLRRKPEVIIVGELRDYETISAAVEASQTGHLVISTAHTTGVPNTVRRLITVFPSNERDGRQADILEQLHMIVAQRLLRTVDGGRVAIREKLIFTQAMKDSLLEADPLKINLAIRRILTDHNEGMIIESKKLFDSGKISELEYKLMEKTFGAEISAMNKEKGEK